MNVADTFAFLIDPSRILQAQKMEADPWQREFLLSRAPYVLLNCSRQAGKSTTVAALALHQLLFKPGALVLLVAPTERQSQELFRKVVHGFRAMGQPLETVLANQLHLELANGSRLVALPGREDTIRSFSGVNLLILDEASRVPDDVYRSVRPMLAVSRGRLIALSTPFGQRGWFYHEWVGSGAWKRLHVPWTSCPRIQPSFIEEELRALGNTWVEQEYLGMFTTMQGLVYPDFDAAIVDDIPTQTGGRVGGIDFGWRNPFAALWGFVDDRDVLWITDEHYQTKQTVFDHVRVLPKDVIWYADPAGASDIHALRKLDYTIRAGRNEIRPGIAQVSARLRTGRLKVARTCTHLLHEARLYRYPDDKDEAVGENPIDAHNHALAALRYLISRLDERRTSTSRDREGAPMECHT